LKPQDLWTETSGFWTETSDFRIISSESLNRNFGFNEPKLRFSYPKFRVFENRSFVFCCCFANNFFFVQPKLRVLIPGFFATKTSEYQIHTQFLTKFRLSGSRRNLKVSGKMKLLWTFKWPHLIFLNSKWAEFLIYCRYTIVIKVQFLEKNLKILKKIQNVKNKKSFSAN
jgi:hypothetical protein